MTKLVFMLVLLTWDGGSAVLPFEYKTKEQCQQAFDTSHGKGYRYIGYVCVEGPEKDNKQ